MKHLPAQKKDATEPMVVFQIEPGEEVLLLAILRFYPVLENSHHRLSKDPKMTGSSAQHLLEESMAQQQAAHRKKLDDLFRTPQRCFKEIQGERRLVLTGSQYEWLLQVLNDIRVGSWIKLGCPDPDKAPEPIARADARSLRAMHLCGQFQMALLEAVK